MSLDPQQESTITFNPWDPEFIVNPYPHYGAVLAKPPQLVKVGAHSAVLVARYADAVAVLHDHENFRSEPPWSPNNQGPFAGSFDILGSDPPRHTRLRRIISRAFTPRRIRDLEPRISEFARASLDTATRKGEFDIMSELANAVPVQVIAEMLGVPPERHATFKNWSDRIVGASAKLVPGAPAMAAATAADAIEAVESAAAYFTEEIEKRRKHPGPDLVSALVAAHDEAEALTATELVQFAVTLLLAGSETTTNLIGNGTLALVRHQDQFERLRLEPSLLLNAIEEMLRFDSPVQSTGRFPHGDVELGDIRDQRCGKPRPGEVSKSRRIRHRAYSERSSGIRRRDPLLHRRTSRAVGGANCFWRDARAYSAAQARPSGSASNLQGFIFLARPRKPNRRDRLTE
jgi:cytochrome P450